MLRCTAANSMLCRLKYCYSGSTWLEFLEGGPRDKTTWRMLVRARTPKRAIHHLLDGWADSLGK